MDSDSLSNSDNNKNNLMADWGDEWQDKNFLGAPR